VKSPLGPELGTTLDISESLSQSTEANQGLVTSADHTSTTGSSASPDDAPGNSLLGLSGWGQRRPLLRGLLLLAFTSFVLFVLFHRIDLNRVVALLRAVPASIWLVATLLTLSFPVMSAVRWHLILRTTGFDVSIARCLLIIVGLWPISSVSPSKSGDLLKAVSLRHQIEPMVVAGSVLTERMLDLFLLAVFALVGGLFFHDSRIVLVAAMVLGGVVAITMIAHLNIDLPIGSRSHSRLKGLLHSIRALSAQPVTLSIILTLTAANWFASIVQTKLLFSGVGASVPLGFTAAALPVALFAGLLPITLAGMGTRDSAIVLLFGNFASSSQALAVGLLYSFFGYWLLAVVGIPFIRQALDW
jgi:uncharacterized membrane protein YbhN (UPF0104 family)